MYRGKKVSATKSNFGLHIDIRMRIMFELKKWQKIENLLKKTTFFSKNSKKIHFFTKN